VTPAFLYTTLSSIKLNQLDATRTYLESITAQYLANLCSDTVIIILYVCRLSVRNSRDLCHGGFLQQFMHQISV